MALVIEQQGERILARIEGEFNIFRAAELKPALLECLASGHDIEIDLSHVDEIDTSGVQLMLMLKREAARTARQLSFVRHSAAALSVIDLLNLAGVLGDPVLITHLN
ncbi:STAS domain-containing protein [Chitinivorax sp. PXF-14]|uniref:STAS domain-containing protein n=1 Tax=Chitinivorax sp. PXF-14 TaxID=3230488 RepID=UPI003467D4FB